MNRIGWLLLFLLAGCHRLTAPLALPHDHLRVCMPLEFTSDVPLAPLEPMIQELTTQQVTLARELALRPTSQPIRVYLFATPEALRTWTSRYDQQLPDRQAFFLQRDGRLEVFACEHAELTRDLRHELTHGYLHGIVPRLPLWLDEGLAEYFELPPDERGVSRSHLAMLQHAQEQVWRPNLQRLETLADGPALGQLDYAEAWLWTHWLMSSPERKTILQNYLRQLATSDSPVPLSQRLLVQESDVNSVVAEHLSELLRTYFPSGG